MVKVVVPDPVIVAPWKVPSDNALPPEYHLYSIVPVFVAGFAGVCVGNVAVAIPTNVAVDNVVLTASGCCINDRIVMPISR